MMLVPAIFSNALCLFHLLNVHAIAVPEGNARKFKPVKDLLAVKDLPPLKAPKFISRVSPEGYNDTIEVANAIKFDAATDVKTAGFIRPGSSINPAFDVKKKLNTRQTKNKCGDSSFENKSSPASAWANVCGVIADTMHHYVVSNDGPAQSEIHPWWPNEYWVGLVWYGSCIFGVHTDFAAAITYIGVEDVRALVVDSINKLQYNNGGWKVGAEG